MSPDNRGLTVTFHILEAHSWRHNLLQKISGGWKILTHARSVMNKHVFHSSKCQQVGVCGKFIYKPSFPQRKLSILRERKKYERTMDHQLVNILKANTWLWGFRRKNGKGNEWEFLCNFFYVFPLSLRAKYLFQNIIMLGWVIPEDGTCWVP